MLRIILIILIPVLLISCNKENSDRQRNESSKTETEQDENETDSAMTAEELFSSAMVENIMGENGDADLEVYLEEQIYPQISKSGKVTIDRISSSLYLLSYDDGGIMKNMVIQKFYNPEKDEFVFDKSETQNNAVKQFVK